MKGIQSKLYKKLSHCDNSKTLLFAVFIKFPTMQRMKWRVLFTESILTDTMDIINLLYFILRWVQYVRLY